MALITTSRTYTTSIATAPGGGVNLGTMGWLQASSNTVTASIVGYQSSLNYFSVISPAVPAADFDPNALWYTVNMYNNQMSWSNITFRLNISNTNANFSNVVYISGSPSISSSTSTNITYARTPSGTCYWNGGSQTLYVTFTAVYDTTPPTITISGVSEGATYGTTVSPTFSASDSQSGVQSCTATLNGGAYTSGTAITSTGSYTLVVTAVDNKNNSTSSTVHFSIDKTPPTITINGVSEGATYTTSVAPTFSASDSSGVQSCTATLNGAGYTSGTTINASAYYTLIVTAVDIYSNSTSSTVHFTLSLNQAPTAPTSVLVNGLSSGLTYITTKTPTFSAIFNDPDSGNTTSIAQVKVGTTSGGSEMWLSGDLAISSTAIGARCPNITYAGTALSSRGIYYITMAFKDNSNVLGAFSTPVQFQIGWAHKAAGQSFPAKVLGQQPNKVDGLT